MLNILENLLTDREKHLAGSRDGIKGFIDLYI